MLNKTQQMEQFNIAYILAIVARAGFNHSTPIVDDHSIDICISAEFPSEQGKRSDPEIKLQLKSEGNVKIKNGIITYRLKKKNYEDLRKPCANPRYLIICDLPKRTTQWLCHKRKFMTLKKHCYWLSLKNFPERKNKSSITLEIPETQRLTVEDLTKMIEYARTGATYEKQ